MDALKVPAPLLQRQLAAIFAAWGMPGEQARISAEVLVAADLLGIDSHGAALMPLYDDLLRSGKVAAAATSEVVREFGATALIDGGGGLGHAPSIQAMDLAVAKAIAFGVGAVAVRNSNHYGAAGIYALRAAGRGLIGLSTSAVFNPSIVPTFGAAPMLGTNPIAFAAPGRRNRPFLLDMATSTAAIGKLKLAQREGRRIPPGWALDPAGRPQTDPDQALRDRLMTPLGGTRELGSHKGYGLATMVEILSTTLAGASFAPLRHEDRPHYDVGHFFLAIHPQAFRGTDGFEAELDALIDALRATRPADPARPVMVAGDPEHAAAEQRNREGVPIPRPLAGAIRDLAQACGAEFLLRA